MKNQIIIILSLVLISCNKKSYKVNSTSVEEEILPQNSSNESISRFITFPQGLRSFNSLPSDVVNDIAVDSSSRIYAATDLGLAFSDDNGATFTTLTTSNGLASNKIDKVIILNDNLICVVVSGGTLQITKDKGKSFLSASEEIWGVRNVSLYNDSLYLVAGYNRSSRRLLKMDLDLENVEVIKDESHQSFKFHNNKIYSLKSGNIFVADYEHDIGEYAQLSQLEDTRIDDFLIYQGHIYLDTHDEGIIVLNLDGVVVNTYYNVEHSKKHIQDISIRDNIFYFASLAGVHKATIGDNGSLENILDISNFSDGIHLKPRSIFVTDQNIYLASSENGVGLSSLQGDLSFNHFSNNVYKTSEALKTISSDEYVYQLFMHGLYKMKKDGSESSVVFKASIGSGFLSDFYLNSDSSMYVAGNFGVKHISSDGQNIADITPLQNKRSKRLLFHNNKLYVATSSDGLYIIKEDSTFVNLKNPQLLSDRVSNLVVSGDNVIVASSEGLNFINNQNQVIRSISSIGDERPLNQSKIKSLYYNNSENVLYMGYSSGLMKLSANAEFIDFKELDLVVTSINSNGENQIFLATWGGVKVINNNLDVVKSFSVADGVSESETNHINVDGVDIYVSTYAGVSKSLKD